MILILYIIKTQVAIQTLSLFSNWYDQRKLIKKMKFKKIVITVTFAAITGREGLLIRDYRKKF